MSEIITPLDNIITLITNLQQQSHVERRLSLNEHLCTKILDNVNQAKNAIITKLLDTQHKSKITQSDDESKSYANVASIKYKPCNSLIVNTGTTKPDLNEQLNTEKRVIETLNAHNAKATIQKTNSTDNGNVVFYFDSKDKIVPLQKAFEDEFGKKVKFKTPILPKIKVVSVPSYFDVSNKEEAVKSIIESNSCIKNALESDKNLMFQFLFSYKRESTQTLIFKISPKIRDLLKKQDDKISVLHKRCPIYDHLHITFCTNCLEYGHKTGSCTKNITICSKCNGTHTLKSCPNKRNSELHKCNSCLNSSDIKIKNLANSHATFDKSCPIFKQKIDNLISRTEYGNYCPKKE